MLYMLIYLDYWPDEEIWQIQPDISDPNASNFIEFPMAKAEL